MIFDVAIIGSGFGGIGAAIRLRDVGINNIAIFERASDLGGTWRDNSYPGCRCDVSSNLYSFSFAPNANWANTYSYQSEIWNYLREVATKYQVRELIKFDHDVRTISFDDVDRQWKIMTSRGEFRARAVILAVGGLAEPRMPEIDGIEEFAGQILHTAAWDASAAIEGQRVGVIGTGASAIQVVPQIAPSATTLTVFQRTPAWILPHLGHPVKTRTKRLFAMLPLAQRFVRWYGYWRRELMVLGFVKDPNRMKTAEAQALQFLEASITDPELRERLTPRYRMGCKRVLISNDFYPALRREYVTLETSEITRVTARGVLTSDGRLHELDTLICATGFHVTDNPMCERVRGNNGVFLSEAFRGDLATYKGTTFANFPNLFMLGGPNTGLGHSSIIFMLESQLNYAVKALRLALRQHVLVEPTAQAADSWTTRLNVKMPSTVWGSGCASWYKNDAGKNTVIWPDFTFTFRRATRHFDMRDHKISV